MYLGGGFAGERLNTLFKESVDEAKILGYLGPIIHDYAKYRQTNEHFGDFVMRTGVLEQQQ